MIPSQGRDHNQSIRQKKIWKVDQKYRDKTHYEPQLSVRNIRNSSRHFKTPKYKAISLALVDKIANLSCTTARPPRSSLHLWLLDIQRLPEQIPRLHAFYWLASSCASLCHMISHWFSFGVFNVFIGSWIGHIQGAPQPVPKAWLSIFHSQISHHHYFSLCGYSIHLFERKSRTRF